jgi:uncharacterized protein YcaQ
MARDLVWCQNCRESFERPADLERWIPATHCARDECQQARHARMACRSRERTLGRARLQLVRSQRAPREETLKPDSLN